MITYPQLRAAEPATWHVTAVAWRRLADTLVERAEEIRGWADRLSGSWSGSAADAGLSRLRELAGALECAAMGCLAVDQILAEFADRVAAAQRALPAVAPSEVAPSEVAPSEVATGPGPAVRTALAQAIETALAQATEADGTAARRLHGAVPDLLCQVDADAPGSPPARPPSGADPAGVRRWWDALTAADRRRLLVRDPARLGGLDGIPVEVRDRANRLALAYERRALSAAGDAVRLRCLDAIHARLTEEGSTRAYLLGFDASGDGRAMIAIGDPDHARNVLTYVPGTGARLADLGEGVLLPAVDRLAARAGVSTAAVLWLGYDAPDNPAVASSGGYARRAEAALDRFEDGLRATHDGPRGHQTVLGHSYGSTVVGYTARDRGLDADDIIFVGSPGVGVANAGDLGLPPGHVWASTAAHDPIRLSATGRALAAVLSWPGTPDLWFGADPSRPRFGGRLFDSAPGSPLRPVATHNGYFDEGNPAFARIVDIAAGDG